MDEPPRTFSGYDAGEAGAAEEERRRQGDKYGRRLMGFGCGGAIFCFLALLLYGYATRTTQEQVERNCAPIIAWLEEQKKANGRYPERLMPEHIAILESFRPRGRYAIHANGQLFTLSWGDYGRDGFTYMWSSDGGGWGMDQ